MRDIQVTEWQAKIWAIDEETATKYREAATKDKVIALKEEAIQQLTNELEVANCIRILAFMISVIIVQASREEIQAVMKHSSEKQGKNNDELRIEFEVRLILRFV